MNCDSFKQLFRSLDEFAVSILPEVSRLQDAEGVQVEALVDLINLFFLEYALFLFPYLCSFLSV